MTVDPLLTHAIRYFLALLLLAAGLHKCADIDRALSVITAYRVVPARFARPLMWLVIVFESMIGTALLFPRAAAAGALAAAGLLMLYFAVLSRALLGRQSIDCGCSLTKHSTRLSVPVLIRNAVLVALAMIASAPSSGRMLTPLDIAQILAAVLALSLVYLTVVDTLVGVAIDSVGRRAKMITSLWSLTPYFGL